MAITRIDQRCIDCGQEVSKRGVRRCKKCNDVFHSLNKDTYNSKCNTMGFAGKRHSKEAKKKISRALTGKKLSLEHRKNISEAICGVNHPKYIDGRTSLVYRIRGLVESDNWRLAVLKRDNYTCQDYGKRGGSDLEAHHKKAFVTILNEFLQEYNQFSPLEDKEILVRLSLNYNPFWNINNGETLCQDCHTKTDNYVKKVKKNVY